MIFVLFLQAGLQIFKKDFNPFVWEEEVQVLRLPHFYLGKFNLNTLSFNILHFLFQALFLLVIGSGVSVIAFICEQLLYKCEQ